jgi:hypothetical protein
VELHSYLIPPIPPDANRPPPGAVPPLVIIVSIVVTIHSYGQWSPEHYMVKTVQSPFLLRTSVALTHSRTIEPGRLEIARTHPAEVATGAQTAASSSSSSIDVV